MYHWILIILLFYFTYFPDLPAQNTDTLFFNVEWVESEKVSNQYYRLIESIAEDTFYVCDFYPHHQLNAVGYTSTKPSTERMWKDQLGQYTSYFENGHIDSTGQYVGGQKEGEWQWFFDNGHLASRELYKNGKRISATFFDKKGKLVPENKAETVMLDSVSALKLIRYIKSSLNYPKKAKMKELEGKVIVRMMVDENGEFSRSSIKVVESVHPLLDQEAIRGAQNISFRLPVYKRHNRPYSFWLNIPFMFEL